MTDKFIFFGKCLLPKRTINNNKGTGAGGANTNLNGLKFEEQTDLQTEFNVIEEHQNHKVIQFNTNNNRYITGTKYQFYKYMSCSVNTSPVCGNYLPDEWYVNEDNKIIFILEKKSQTGSGSVDEKLQTVPCKLWNYKQMFPDYVTIYTFTLSDWFKHTKYHNEMNYLNLNNTPVFWGSDENYKSQIVDYITNYQL